MNSDESSVHLPCYAVQVYVKSRWRSEAILLPSLGYTSELAARRVLVKMQKREPGRKFRLVYSPQMKPV